jgi:hypothetical protein
MNLMVVSDFIQVQGSKWNNFTKDGNFSKEEGFTKIYLLKIKD